MNTPATVSTNKSNSNIDVRSLLLEVVSEKTGYPTDSLGMDMTLEGDLGIDSIKRVEILSTMQERAPSLPEVDGASMATLQTLGEIVSFLGVDSSPETSSKEETRASSNSNIDVRSLLLEVVSEKTGYPTDSLGMDMTLEGDLGIDSIKRVEILSTMQERAPSLPEVDGASMATLQTLGGCSFYDTKQGQPCSRGGREFCKNFTKAELSITDNSATTAPCSMVQLTPKPRGDVQHPLQELILSETLVVLGDGYFAKNLRSKLKEKGIRVQNALEEPSSTRTCFVIDLRPLNWSGRIKMIHNLFQRPYRCLGCVFDGSANEYELETKCWLSYKATMDLV